MEFGIDKKELTPTLSVSGRERGGYSAVSMSVIGRGRGGYSAVSMSVSGR